MMKGIIVAGGTGGHIYPGITIGKKIKELYPDVDLLFVGRKREMDRQIYENEGFLFEGINIMSLSKNSPLSTGIKFMRGVFESLIIFSKYRPDFVLGMGSYISFPMLFWASLFNVPVFLQEQNVMPGIATLLLQNRVSKIFLGYGETASYLKFKEKIAITGNPLRFKDTDKVKKKREILVLGGSLGAKAISEKVVEVVEYIKKNNISFDYKFVLITGKQDYEIFSGYADKERLIVYPYVNNIEELYKRAVLVISRAGALTISEIAYFGLPAILIPYPFSKRGHQYLNADLLIKNGNAVLIKNESLTVDLLLKEVYNILKDKKKLKSYYFKSFKFLFKNSAEKIAKYMIEFNKKEEGNPINRKGKLNGNNK